MKQNKRSLRIFSGKTNFEKVLFSIVFLLFVIYSFILIYPLFWGLMSSFKTVDAYFDNTFGLPEFPWQFQNYALALEADDRAVLSAAMRYQSIVHDPANALPLYAFFAPFEDGRPRRGEFEEIFEHSFFALAVSARMKKMGLLHVKSRGCEMRPKSWTSNWRVSFL